MKVYVTQGHQSGVGLEVFFKTCLLLTEEEVSTLKFLAFQPSVKTTLEALKLPYTFYDDHINLAGINIATQWLDKVDYSESFTSLKLGMMLSESGGVLYTLPTSKDQFPGHPGHTEYFRAIYKKPELGMFFSSSRMQVLLLSDHIKVADLSSSLTEETIYQRLNEAISCLQKWKWPIKRILVSGLNPHAGEGGMLGQEDSRITSALNRLTSVHKFPITGPFPGDTMALEQNDPHDLLVYLFHDQGLGVFKGLEGFVGSNITLGLLYPRFSPDHGTSFKLYGKNQADYRGCAYSLRQAIEMLRRISHGQNSGHQS